MSGAIAIVGIACQFPDASTPAQLWENALAQRRAFRRLPPERVNLDDYFSSDRDAPDRFYSTRAALITDYEFDRIKFKVAGATYRSADMAHWLTLDIASRALEDAGFTDGKGLLRLTTGVLLGNTLTGEFSRANVMRLRWPYVSRILNYALQGEGWSEDKRADFLHRLEESYKEPFPPVGEETLAGGLSNTIAGRICNYFDLKGGGYTLDGACASSLLAISKGCSALADGELDVLIAGGVDLSIDPFELVGFAKTGALAEEKMRVFDSHSAGFWPGEGCGIVVLMREEDVPKGRNIYSLIRGWGISSDGSGGITRPDEDGQRLAIERAYRRAGVGIETVAYFEGHGTGTSVGDAIELRALAAVRRKSSPNGAPAAIGTIKANIGHTKAAAGVAGVIKATMALYNGLIPPTTGCDEPHPEIVENSSCLRIPKNAEPWPESGIMRAGVSAMGFGGINVHVVLEGKSPRQTRIGSAHQAPQISCNQDCELFLFSAESIEDLIRQVEEIAAIASHLSESELTDLSAYLHHQSAGKRFRASIVASHAEQLSERLQILSKHLKRGQTRHLDILNNIYIGENKTAPRLGFLFPGQGMTGALNEQYWRRRFPFVADFYETTDIQTLSDGDTSIAQPAIVRSSLVARRILEKLGITASAAIGHSLGELTAWHWAGAIDESALLRITEARGKAMSKLRNVTGAMASISARPDEVSKIIEGLPLVIAGLNSPRQTVISGEDSGIDIAINRARSMGFEVVKLSVSNAFHSPLMTDAAPALAESLALENFLSISRMVFSSITGRRINQSENIKELLIKQLTSPVRFHEAILSASEHIDLFIETGPGNILQGLVRDITDIPVISFDSSRNSIRGLLNAMGASFALGAMVDFDEYFAGRFFRQFNPKKRPKFFVNPCELAPKSGFDMAAHSQAKSKQPAAADDPSDARTISTLELVRSLVAKRAELPLSAIRNECRLLSDLHLNSIIVGQIVATAAKSMRITPPMDPTRFSNATISEIAGSLDNFRMSADTTAEDLQLAPPGIDSWVDMFKVETIRRPLLRKPRVDSGGSWHVISSADHRLGAEIHKAFRQADFGRGVVVCLTPDPSLDHIDLLLEGARRIVDCPKPATFVLVQNKGCGSGFAKTIYQEIPNTNVTVIAIDDHHPEAVKLILDEAMHSEGFVEVSYTATSSGERRVPVMRRLDSDEAQSETILDRDDLLLVTGGGKGIAAECALALAKETGVKLAIFGRSRPDRDTELSTNLKRLKLSGITYRYLETDVSDAMSVKSSIDIIKNEMGPITAILHGAGINRPQLLAGLNRNSIIDTLKPKVFGAENLIAAVDGDKLKLFVAFGSIIARTGMRGEADYAMANEWMSHIVRKFKREHPHCHCLTVEWSVWSGTGMGKRLDRVEALAQQGITPISTDSGIKIFNKLVRLKNAPTEVIVAGRIGNPPTLELDKVAIPLRRFIEEVRIHYPGIELVADAELSLDSDFYLKDHTYHGEHLFPAVMGLEAMAQIAQALAETAEIPIFRNVKFSRPIVVAEGSKEGIRLAAMQKSKGVVTAAIRCKSTAYQIDHFSADCHFGEAPSIESCFSSFPEGISRSLPSINPKEDLYGSILFQTGRFNRLESFSHLRSKECVAEISYDSTVEWFNHHYPGQLALGDPGAADAIIHSIQACIPHRRLLPIQIERIEYLAMPDDGYCYLRAKERSHQEPTYIYDLEIADEKGGLIQRWRGLHLRAMESIPAPDKWAEPLFSNYVERCLAELIPGSNALFHLGHSNGKPREICSEQAISSLLGSRICITRRPDGKPDAIGELNISTSHGGEITIAAAHPGLISCDIQIIHPKSESNWGDLLGSERFQLSRILSKEIHEEFDISATRVWSSLECLKKAGLEVDAPMIYQSKTADGWIILKSNSSLIATLEEFSIANVNGKFILGVLIGPKE